MTIELKPIGRGNWTPLVMQLDGARAQPLLFRVGEVIQAETLPSLSVARTRQTNVLLSAYRRLSEAAGPL